ncbi:MAG: dephospho-CoA kinase [Acidimicrobiia bacterium]
MAMIGLTGGIGAGKSTVAQLLRDRGAVVIDADAIARQVVEPGEPALARIVERFGADILNDDGSLNRAALAARAFADTESKQALDTITHPAIAAEFVRQLEAVTPGTVVVHDVPLLVESLGADRYGGVIVVEAPVEMRLARLEARGVPRTDAEARIAQQATDEQRRAVATWVLDNAGDVAHLAAQVDAIWPEIVAIAQPQS